MDRLIQLRVHSFAILEFRWARSYLHFAGLPNEIIISKSWTHNVEDIESLLIQIHDEPFTLRIY